MTQKSSHIFRRVVVWCLIFIPVFFALIFILNILNRVQYHSSVEAPRQQTRKKYVEHMPTPSAVRAVYVSQCGATSARLRTYIEDLIKNTELNAIIIDAKDSTGTVSFRPDSGGKGCKINDLREWLKHLHSKGIYTIARIVVFQDTYYTGTHPELAVHKKFANTVPWQDYRGMSFIDVGAINFWKYIVGIAQDAHTLGFDELNFDYIRYPSDGNMHDVYYSHSGGENGVVASKEVELEKFFSYLSHRLKRVETGTHVPVLSADLFGMTTTNKDDLSIGQVQERAIPYFDFIAPMVYPSHYPSWFLGLDNPNENVYKVVNYSMREAVKRVMATSTLPIFRDKYKLRPWLQDFDYGGDYDATKVRAQIQATYDAGLNSWMLWNPANRYTRGALQSSN